MVRVWAQWPAELTPKVANIIPGSPVAFEGMPAGGLLAGTVCLSPALAGSLRGADAARVGNMGDEGLDIKRECILNSISSQGPAIFWLSLQKIIEATLWAWTGLGKRA